MKLPFIILSLVFALSPLRADTPVDTTLVRLAHVEFFAFGRISAGFISQGEKDYREILFRSTALADFHKLFQIGNPQAKCYALVGIHALEPKVFKKLPDSIHSESPNCICSEKAEVMTLSGCIGRHKSFASILEEIEAGNYDHGMLPKNNSGK